MPAFPCGIIIQYALLLVIGPRRALPVRVTVARSAGFCFGVRRAIEIARRAASGDGKVVMLGDLVHNELVTSEIRRRGIRKISRLGDGRGKTVLIRAHGASATLYDSIRRAGYGIIDATCPKVKEIHAIARADEKKGYRVVIIGDRDHDEVLGIRGNLEREPVLVQPVGRFPARRFEGVTRASVVVQSTQDRERVLRIVERIRSLVPEVIFHNTICAPTTSRQREARKLASQCEAVFVIGSHKSANTRRLYEISRKINRRTFRIDSWKQIAGHDLSGVEEIGVIAGASTPDSLIREVVEHLGGLPATAGKAARKPVKEGS